MTATRSSWLRAWAEPLADALFPRRCRLCGADAEGDLACEPHAFRIGLEGPRCDRCAAGLAAALPDGTRCRECRRRRPAFRGVVAAGDYEDAALREWVLALKHGGRRDLAEPLALALVAAARGRLATGDLFVPVPLSPWRRLERGYDQAALLAAAVARAARGRCLRALARTRPTPPQGAAGSTSRRANVRGAFDLRGRSRARLEGRRAWLVDDVLTSGATAEACTRVLRAAGAETPGVLVVARAAPRAGPRGDRAGATLSA